jgi:hypothetical protein
MVVKYSQESCGLHLWSTIKLLPEELDSILKSWANHIPKMPLFLVVCDYNANHIVKYENNWKI